PEELRKTQIETDKKPDARPLDVHDNGTVALRVDLVFTGVREESLLAIDGGDASRRIEQNRGVHQTRGGCFAHGQSGEHPHAVLARCRRESTACALISAERLGPTVAFHRES